MGSKKRRKAKNLAAKRQNEFDVVLKEFRSEKRSSSNFFMSFFRSSNRIKIIREKYKHHQKSESRGLVLTLKFYLKTAAEILHPAEMAELFGQLASRVRMPKITIIKFRRFKLPRPTISHLALPKIPRIKLQLRKPVLRLPKITWPKLDSFKLPAIDFSKFMSRILLIINVSKLKSVKLPEINLVSRLKSLELPRINIVSKLKSVKLPEINIVSRLKSLELPRINIVSKLKSVNWFGARGLKISEMRVLEELAVTLPEITWSHINADKIPGFLPKSVGQKIAGLNIPKFKVPELAFIQQKTRLGNGNVYLKTAVLSLLIFGLSWLPIYENMQVPAYALQVDGQTIAYSNDKTVAENVVTSLKEERAISLKRKVELARNVTFVEVKAKRDQLESPEDLRELLSTKLSFVAVATGVKINDELAFAVSDNETAQRVLQQLKDSYIQEGMKIENVSFAEKVEMVDIPMSIANVKPFDEALRILKEGREKKTVHIVEDGESLWAIAHKYGLQVEDLQTANPSIKGEHVDIGQEINLVAVEPLINVQVAGELTVTETVPYKVKVETDRSLWRGTEKVKVSGENGLREVTYKVVMENGSIVNREEVTENVLKPVKNKVVVRGSKIVVASRGGSGPIGWPIGGRITSGYGTRWGRAHTGLDIDGVTGQPVGAAAAGVVTSVGYEGAYGKMIRIRHDNGMVTRYAHLSQYKVSVGQKVERGDLIGLVGNTGRSTGSHLHFEVLVNGSFKNPLTYLK